VKAFSVSCFAMLTDRRLFARLTALCVGTSKLPSHAVGTAGGASPIGLAVVAGGFLIPAPQYASYARALDQIGVSAAVYADASTLSQPQELAVGARALLSLAEARATDLKLPSSTPLFLIGHSRGCKTCIAAAAQSTRPVGALVLVDPVDKTGPDPSTVLPTLEALAVPTAILGSGKSGYDCAPTGANYVSFSEALARSCTPQMVGLLTRAGHTQFVDNRRVLAVDVCTTGKDSDDSIREVALATTTAWVTAALSSDSQIQDTKQTRDGTSNARESAVARLRDTPFRAAVMFQARDL
jgi:hypothetical protein